MSLGYMGWVQLGSIYALGTGTAVPRARSRIDSGGAYGQNVIGVSTIGIGAPRAYDWDIYDGTLNFEITKDIFLALKAWVLARASQTTITFSTRKDNEQSFVDTLWNSISISASEGALLDGSLGFVAMDRASYLYGVQGMLTVVGSLPTPNVAAGVVGQLDRRAVIVGHRELELIALGGGVEHAGDTGILLPGQGTEKAP
jgi:hypothetical protein